MKKPLRSQAWFGGTGKDAFIHRSWMKNQGHPEDMFDGRPVIGICNTASDLTPCNAHFRQLVEPIKRGIYEAGGFPVEFPVFSCGESNLRPTAMMFRNLASMDVEESIRDNPIDGVVLLAGCDKTTPSLVMGAASVDLPSIVLSGGAMLSGWFKGKKIGSGTDVWRLSEDVRAGVISMDEFLAAEESMSRSPGHCMTMGTASTMASMVEALGLSLPGNAAIPAIDARRARLAHLTGRRIVEMVNEDLKLSQILTRAAFENAVKVNGAIGGSTNAVVHLLAIAGRVGVEFSLDDWDRFGRDIPTLANLMPSGEHLMEDFFYAGGIPALMQRISASLRLEALTVNGRTVGDNIMKAEVYLPDVIRPLDQPLVEHGGMVVLRGNLAPNGAVLKPSAATPALLEHRGPAVVFNDIEDYKHRIADPNLAITAQSIMVLRNCGPKGYPGMAEVGNMGLPAKLLEQGVRDMVRISDARMSGTAYGTVVLHVAPEAAAGGPLALVREGDEITLSVSRRELTLHVEEAELDRRRAEWQPPAALQESGYRGLYRRHVMQADTGADFDFLLGCRGSAVPEESH